MITFKQFILESAPNQLPKKVQVWAEGLPLLVQSNNKPQQDKYILYAHHGSQQSFSGPFDTTKSPYSLGASAFFTPNKDRAKGYMYPSWSKVRGSFPKGSKLYNAFLKIKNPYYTESLEGFNQIALKIYRTNEKEFYRLAEKIGKFYGYTHSPDGRYNGVGMQQISNEWCRENGYNCIIHSRDGDGIMEICMFYAKDIYRIN